MADITTSTAIDTLLQAANAADARTALGLGSVATLASTHVLSRSNHTGTQASTTISDFNAAAAAVAPVQSVNGATGTVNLTKSDIGLGNAENTTDANKPVSTATQTALDLKANLANPTFTGVPVAPTAAANTNTTQLATTEFVTRAKRSDRVSVLDYGAVGNGVTDDTAAFTAAIATGKTVYVPALASGSYRIQSKITLPAGTVIEGDGAKSVLLVATGAITLFDITGNDVRVSGLKIDCTGVSSIVCFKLRNDLAALERIRIADILTWGAATFLQDESSTANIIVNLQILNVTCRTHKGVGVYLRKLYAYGHLERVTIDYVSGTPNGNTGFWLEGNAGCWFNKCDVTGGTVDAGTSNNNGFYFVNCVAVWMVDCMADTVAGIGFWLASGCTFFYLVNCVASLCKSHGFAVESAAVTSTGVTLQNCTASGRAGQAYAPNANGFNLAGDQIAITGGRARANVQAGVNLSSATGVAISGLLAISNGTYGLDSTGTGTVSLCTGVAFRGNTTANARHTGANQHITACQGNSGALISLSGSGTV